MKKVFTVIIVSLMFFISLSPVIAEGKQKEQNAITYLEDNEFMKNIIIEDFSNLITNDIRFTISYYSVEDAQNMMIERINNHIYAYNQKGVIISHAELISSNFNTPHTLVIPRAGWSSWYFAGQSNVKIDNIAGISVSTIASLMCAAPGIPQIVGISVTAVLAVASVIKEVTTDYSALVYTKYYYSGYSSCGILVKGKADSFSNSNYTGLYGTSYTDPHWEGNPYDYTQPSACRELTSQYPY